MKQKRAFAPLSETFENIKSADVSISDANSSHLFITMHS